MTTIKNKARRAYRARIYAFVVVFMMIAATMFGIIIVAISNKDGAKQTLQVQITPMQPSVAEKFVEPECQDNISVDTLVDLGASEEYLEPEPEVDVEPEPVIYLTEQEFWDFCLIVAAEAGGEPFEGQVAVAAVIINRIQSPDYPNYFYGVIRQAEQFATVVDGKIVSDWIEDYSEIPLKTIDAVKVALTGEDPTEELLENEAIRLGLNPEMHAEGGALFFYSPKHCRQEEFEKRELVKVKIQIENHMFFKLWPKQA